MLFLIYNYVSFQQLGFADLFASIWFDLITVCLIGLPFIILSLIPLPFREKIFYGKFLSILFYVFLLFFVALNLIDVEYFRYTQKRSTFDMFTVLSGSNDFMQQLASFFRDFWLLLIFLLGIIVVARFFHKKAKVKTGNFKFFRDFLYFILFIGLAVFFGRGGFRLKPINPIDAAQFTRVENAALVLNTAFTMVKSYNQGGLEEKNYFSQEKEARLFNPIKVSKPLNLLPEKTNLVVIMLESFGNEWVGAAGAKKSFTPFLDSLSNVSLYFKNGISNGKKSIEAVPSIVASIPSLSDNPYISSQYGNNKINSLASILNDKGYETAFFHGATNGSMRFDGFASQIGFQHYFGRTEYNNDKYFDQSWGILDEYFNPWTAKKLSEFDKPFFATLFTLSSHHPYFIPKHMRGKLRKGSQEICQSIHYGDYSLNLFFEEAKKQPWYKNTVFILCADHTSASSNPVYNQRSELYKIPVLIFDPSGKIAPKKETQFFQHLDIMPTALDLLNVKTKFYAFGNSYFQSKQGEAINYLEGTYQYFKGNKMITFTNEKVRNLYTISEVHDNNPDSLSFYRKEAKRYELRLKAMIQRYNRDLITNQNFSK